MSFPSRRLAAALALPVVLLAGCNPIPLSSGYPAVARTDLVPVVTPGADTAWALARPPITVVGRSSATVELPAGITGVVRGWERLFGTGPAPVTVVLVDAPPRGTPVAPVLPDSLERRAVVWVPVMPFDDGDRARRTGGPAPAGMPVMMSGAVGRSASLQVAQAWLDDHVMGTAGSVTLPPWLRAGLVEALGGTLTRRSFEGRRGGDVPRLPLDTLLARRCGDDWAPVPRWRPRPPGGVAGADSAAGRPAAAVAPERRDRRSARERSRDPRRAFEEQLRDPCGLGLRVEASSFVRFLLDRAGDRTADRLVRTFVAGGTLEQALAGATGVPDSIPELERAWRAWEVQR